MATVKSQKMLCFQANTVVEQIGHEKNWMPVLLWLPLLSKYAESKVKYVTDMYYDQTTDICLVCHKVLAVWLIFG